MTETFSYAVFRHKTDAPHWDLFVTSGDGRAMHWIVPSGIPVEEKDKRLAVGGSAPEDIPEGVPGECAYGDGYGRGEAEPWDRGACTIEMSNKIKMVLSVGGERMRGKYLFIIPAWGRWTEKRLWVIEKIGPA
ncbi:MAG TPA: hypothetical protein PKC29_06550 [Thermodesulfobacteriota bacterium]|nr:hypothetical protein [Thermodesulfobacteriota bacterium]